MSECDLVSNLSSTVRLQYEKLLKHQKAARIDFECWMDGYDYKVPIKVERIDSTDPESKKTITVDLLDKDGNVVMQTKNSATRLEFYRTHIVKELRNKNNNCEYIDHLLWLTQHIPLKRKD